MRGQWAGEGYMAAMIILTAGIGFIFTYFIDHFETQHNRYLYGTFAIAFTLSFIEIVKFIYSIKGGDTNTSFWPPSHYLKGPLMVDNGYTV